MLGWASRLCHRLTELTRRVSGLGPLLALGGGLIGEAENFDAAISDADKAKACSRFWRGVHRRVTKPVLLREYFRPCYTSTTSTYKIGVARIVAAYKTRIGRGCMVAHRRSNSKNSAPPNFLGRVLGKTGLGCFSRWAILSFCGGVERSPRFGGRSGTPRVLFGKERCSVVPGGGDWPHCRGTWLLASRFFLGVIRVTRTNKGRLSCAHATTPGGTFRGGSRRWGRRSHAGVAVGLSDTAGKRPLVVVSVQQRG